MDMISGEKVEELKGSINNWGKDVATRINQDYDKLCSALGEKMARMLCEEFEQGHIKRFNEGTIRELISNQLGAMKYNIISKKMQPLLQDGMHDLGNSIRDYCLLDENIDTDEVNYTKRKAEERKDYHKEDASKAFDFEREYNDCIDEIMADVRGHILRQNYDDPLSYDKFADIRSHVARTLKGSIYGMLQQTLNDNTKKMYLTTYENIASEVINELDTYVKDKTKNKKDIDNERDENKNNIGNEEIDSGSDLEDMFY